MLDAFLMTFEKMAQLILFVALGYGCNRLKLIPHAAEQVMSLFVTLLLLPSLNLYTGIVECRLDSLGQYGVLVLVGGVFCLLSIGLSYPTSKLFVKNNAYEQGVYRYALSIPNTGAVGTPLMLAFFGTAGMFQYSLFQFVASVLTYSWGIAQLQPDHGKTSLWSNLRKCINPAFTALVIGMLLGVLGAKVWMPAPVINVLHDLSNCYVPMALLMTGYALADYPFGKVFGSLRVYLYTAWRLVALPCIYLAVLLAFKAPLMMATMMAMTYTGPCGMNVVIYPAAYGEECPSGASMVLISTLVSIVTVPLIYALVQVFFS